MKNQITTIISTTILLVLGCFGLVPRNAFGVVPAPGDWYPGGNTASGQDALFSRTSGVYNTAVGLNALYSDTSGSRNTANGVNALRFNATGRSNTAIGTNALYHNTMGIDNTAVGDSALFSNSGGFFTGNYNTAIGVGALFSNSGVGPTFAGTSNTAVGFQALYYNTGGYYNTAIGDDALFSNTTGAANTAIGELALNFNNTGDFNTAIGIRALQRSHGGGNTAVGAGAGYDVTVANDVICIGDGVAGANVNNSCYVGNIWNQPGGTQAVYVNSDGKLGYLSSSRRFKDEIKPINQASALVYRLRPVSFRYKPEIEPTRPIGFGLIAEEVEKVSPDLVSHDADGKSGFVRYDQVNAMLLNEFLKEHRTVQDLKKEVAELKAGLQKVNAQLATANRSAGGLEMRGPAARLAADNR
jgi:trimeric autotransporter adhesin